MPLYEFNNLRPSVGDGTWIAPSAEIIGDVTIGKNCYIGFGAVIRGDFGSITIGNESLIEENVVIHTATRTEIGNRVIVGHMAMIHDALIKDGSLVGMKATICEGVEIDESAIIAEQSLVKKNQKNPIGYNLCRKSGKVQKESDKTASRDVGIWDSSLYGVD